MNCVPINFDLISKVYDDNFVDMLHHFKIKNFIDVNSYAREKGTYPCISSIWYLGGGSYDFNDKKYGIVYIHNGTLSNINHKSVGFGKNYYKTHMGESLLDEFKFREIETSLAVPGKIIEDHLVISLEEVKSMQNSNQIKESDIEFKWQYWRGNNWRGNNKNFIITIISDDKKRYLFKGRYDTITHEFLPPHS
jgi:hypothetical protein